MKMKATRWHNRPSDLNFTLCEAERPCILPSSHLLVCVVQVSELHTQKALYKRNFIYRLLLIFDLLCTIMAEKDNSFVKFMNTLYYVVDAPVTYIREKFIVPNQKKYPWYHQQYRRVPTIDECYTDDIVCYTEANCQFMRDKSVEDEILFILRSRYEHCIFYHGDDRYLCDDLKKAYFDASTAWFTKYGDMGIALNAKNAYMKQKHRMIWERRHGPVGSGMRSQPTEA